MDKETDMKQKVHGKVNFLGFTALCLTMAIGLTIQQKTFKADDVNESVAKDYNAKIQEIEGNYQSINRVLSVSGQKVSLFDSTLVKFNSNEKGEARIAMNMEKMNSPIAPSRQQLPVLLWTDANQSSKVSWEKTGLVLGDLKPNAHYVIRVGLALRTNNAKGNLQTFWHSDYKDCQSACAILIGKPQVRKIDPVHEGAMVSNAILSIRNQMTFDYVGLLPLGILALGTAGRLMGLNTRRKVKSFFNSETTAPIQLKTMKM